MSYNDTNCGHTGWGVGLSAIIGGALGYWAGRSSGPGGFGGCGGYGFPAGYAVAAQNGHCSTCFEQGVESGQTRRSELHRPAGRRQQQRHRQLHGCTRQSDQQSDSCYSGAFRCAQPAEDCGSGCLDRGAAHAERCRSQCCGYQHAAHESER